MALMFVALSPVAAAEPEATGATMCGRSGSIIDLLIGMQKPSVESIWRDKVMFIQRDAEDNSI